MPLFALFSALFLMLALAPAPAPTAARSPERGFVSDDPDAFDAFPSIAKIDGGRLLCVFSRKVGDAPLVVVACRSDDHGRTWSAPMTLLRSAEEVHYDPNIVVIGSRVLVSSTAVPVGDAGRIATSRTMAVTSDDGGLTWSAPREVPMGRRYTSGKVNNGIMLRDGTAMFGFTWERNLETVESLTSEGDMEEVNAAMLSFDGGRTWAAGGSISLECRRADDRPEAINGLCEPALAECRDGSVFMLSRTGLERLYASRSTDGGRSWSAAEPTMLVSHNAPASLCRFTSDRGEGLLVVWNHSRTDRWPLSAAASFDDGRTWTTPIALTHTPGLESSYPGCVQADDGTLVVVHQQNRADGGRKIAVTRFEPEALRLPPTVEPNVCTTPLSRPDASWVARHEEFNARARSERAEVLFIGDSITHRWESAGPEVWQAFYGERRAMNLGIDGDGTQTVLWRLAHGNLEGQSPKVAVVMIGTNNSTDPRQTPEMIASGVAAIVAKLRHELPETRVLVLGIFPRGQTPTPERERGAATNRLVAPLADGEMVHYLDIGAAFLEPDGSISREVMPDYLHLSAEGYRRWAEAMEPTLARLLKEGAVEGQ